MSVELHEEANLAIASRNHLSFVKASLAPTFENRSFGFDVHRQIGISRIFTSNREGVNNGNRRAKA